MEAEKFHKEENRRLTKELEKVKFQLGKITEQRRQLLKQLDQTEHRAKELAAFQKRFIPVLSQIGSTSENKDVHSLLSELKKLAKEGAPLQQLEQIFQQIKDITFRSDVQSGPSSPKKSKTSSLLKFFQKESAVSTPGIQPSESIHHLIDTYYDIIHELKLNLGQNALPQLSTLESQVGQAKEIEDLLPVRKKILSLLNDYIKRVSTEREEAAAFIQEISGQLIQVEKHLFNSLSFAKEAQAASSSFTDEIENQLSEFKESVDFSTTLQELKLSISSSISVIQSAIEEKRKIDRTRVSQTDQQMQVLQKDLLLMKGEISEAKERAEQLEHELLLDPLTGAFNRRAYDFKIREELKRFQRYGSIFSIMILDVDHFKQINDQYGHNVGDLCLKEIINRIKPLLRESDFLARYGGEEFIVLLPETRIKGAAGVAEKLRQMIEKTEFLHKGEPVKVTISIGVTEVRQEDTAPESLFERVDRALYKAKGSGRNRVITL